MFGEVFRFELGYQLRRKSTWIYFLLLMALMLQVTVESFFPSSRANGFFFNSQYTVAGACIFGSFFGIIITAGIAGDAAARDVATRLSPLMYTTPVTKAAHLGGRFLAAFVVVALLLLALPVGQLVAVLLPGLEPELIAPMRLSTYALPYVALLLPTAFITTALLFCAAVLARRAMASYAAAAFLALAGIFVNAVLAQTKGLWTLAKKLEPFMLNTLSELSRSLTPAQKDAWSAATDPSVMTNRAIWIPVALAVLAFTYARFRFVHEAEGRPQGWLSRIFSRKPRGAGTEPHADAVERAALGGPAAPLPRASQHFGPGARWRQLGAVTARSFNAIARSRGVLAVAAIALVVAFTGPEMMEHLGVPLVPVTGYIAKALSGDMDFFGFVAPLLCVFYAGELVWRERDAGLAALTDATPTPDWLPLLGKGLGLGLALAAWQGLLVLAGMTTQLLMGHHDLQPLLWLQVMLGVGLPVHLLFGVLAITVHVLVNQKYMGHVVGLMLYGVMLFASAFGLEHHLLRFASAPAWTYSDMRGFGGSLVPWAWFTLYWAGWALLLAVVARLLWVRGTETGWAARRDMARARLSRPVLATAVVGLLVIAGAGGTVFYNTNVRNGYANGAAREQRQADYERQYARYADVPQPALASTRLRVELYPAASRAVVEGRQVFTNRTTRPIGTLHLETSAVVDTTALRVDRPSRVLRDDTALRHRIIRLEQPLLPGETLRMDYTLRYGGRGFTNDGVDQTITPGASHFEEGWLPVFGYQRSREIADDGKRRLLGLKPRPEIPPVTDVAARYDLRGSERIHVDTIVGTVAGQTAVAPGRLRRQWSVGDRRYFHYATDRPMRNNFGIYSAAYAVHRARWRDVPITMYYHPKHGLNVARLVRAAQASLEQHTRTLGPYPHAQLTLVEAPGLFLSARAHAASIRLFEGYALMNPDADWRKIDFAYAVMGHELAHQWWGNQVTPAAVAGAPFVAESLAWFSAFGVIEKTYGAAHLARFLDVLREDYLDPRARDGVPLLEAQDAFAAYRLGPFAMVALRDAIGDARINQALGAFAAKYRDGAAPLPTSLDLYAELRAVTPPAQHELLADLFARNTFWDFRTWSASATPVGPARDDLWRVTMHFTVGKVSVDRAGKETPRPLPEPIELGVYGPEASEADGGGMGKPLYLRKHVLKPGEQRIVLLVHGRPERAGLDPRNILIDTKRYDNVKRVAIATP